MLPSFSCEFPAKDIYTTILDKFHRGVQMRLYVFILFILCICLADAVVFVDDIECSDTGAVSFKAEYMCSRDNCSLRKKPSSALNITAISGQDVYNVELEDQPEWITTKAATFVSKDAILDPNRVYKIYFDDGEEKLIEEGRLYARAHHTTLNALIRVLLAQTVRENRENWISDCFQQMDNAKGHSGGKKWTREELYDV